MSLDTCLDLCDNTNGITAEKLVTCKGNCHDNNGANPIEASWIFTTATLWMYQFLI